MEPLPAMYIPSFEQWSDDAIQYLEEQLETAGYPIFVITTYERSGKPSSAAKRFIKGNRTDINQMMGYRSLFEMHTPSEVCDCYIWICE